MLKHDQILKAVKSLQPGQRINFHRHDIVPHSFVLLGFVFEGRSAWDRVLDNICGSAYEYRYWEDAESQCVIFERLPKPLDDNSGLRSYVEPDRRDRFTIRPDGLYELR